MRALVLALLFACSSPAAMSDRRIDVMVTSGRPQPPPENVAVRVGEPVVVHAEGLGPPRVVVFAPDGSTVPTTDVATGQRFVPTVAGTYRVEQAEAPGLVLVTVVAR